MKKVLISGIFVGLLITVAAIAAILYATGYRLEFGGKGTGNIKFVEGTGLLVATSRPDGARVLIDGELATATNNTINLGPGEYDVEIQKDGYIPWKKKVTINKNLVSEANALLLPAAPKLEAVTTVGVSDVVMDESGSLLAYTVASASAQKNGIYVLNMNAGPLVFLGASGTQIINDVLDNFSSATLSFSPDGKQVLAELPLAYYLLPSGGSTNNPQDVSNTLGIVMEDWETQRVDAHEKYVESLPRKLRNASETYFAEPSLSPDKNRILYTASSSATLPVIIEPPVPSVNSTPDQRELDEGDIYVYDIKEDKNYKIADGKNEEEEKVNYLWFADSRHLVFAEDSKVNIVEYDGGNLTGVFNGNFLDSLLFPWPDGSSIGIVYRLSNSVPYNIYRLGLQ